MGSKASDTNSSSDPLPSTASFMTSTLLSRRFNINNNNNNPSLGNNKKQGNRYNMGTVGRSCVNTIRRSRQNVAIATQVLSPSAIGGSLKGHSVARHFGPPDDDEEGFITYRRHAAWRKLCYYGSAIVAVILILMAIILAVGYLQSEKHKRVLSRSVKLVQDRKPSSYIYASTTEASASLEPTDSHEFFPTAQSSFLLSDTEDSYSSADKGTHQNGLFYSSSGESSHKNVIDEDDDYYNHEENNGNHVSVHLGVITSNHSDEVENNKDNFLLYVNDHITIEDHGNEPDTTRDGQNDNGESQEVTPSLQSLQSVDKLDNDLDTIRFENESVDDDDNNNNNKNNEQWQSITENIKEQVEEHHPLPSEVKVLPPKDFVFSIEIPIYTPNNTITAAVQNNNDDNTGDTNNNVSTTTPSEELSEEEFVEKSESNNVQSENNNENEQLEKLENDTKKDNAQNLEGKQLEDDSEVSEEFKESSGFTKFEDAQDLNENANKFHAVLHTALFNVNDETVNDEPKNIANSPSTIKSEDSDEAAAYSDENVEVSYSETSDSDEQINDRSRGRNRHIKLLKNDKVMNLKATYTPKYASETKQVTSEEPFPKSDVAAQILRLNQIRQGITQLLNKSLTTQRPKITSSDNLKDFVLDQSVTQRLPVASSTQQVASLPPLSTKASGGDAELKESGRSLSSSSSSLPDFGILDFNAILQSQNLLPQKEVKSNDQQHARSDFGENFAFNLNQFLPPATSALPASSGPLQDSSQSQLSKRTYNEYDFNIGSPSASQSSTSLGLNYFDHLLGQNPAVGTIGNPSAAGATLSSYYSPIFPSAPSANYDISSSATSDTPSLAPGSIPLDLASSFIQVGHPGHYSGTGQGQQQQQQQQAYNPFQTQATAQSQFGNNGGVGSLTTLSGTAPQYNTIAQGMHLLNLISGTVPNTFYHDQVYNPNLNNGQQGAASFQTDSFKSPSEFHFGTSPSLPPPVNSYSNFGDSSSQTQSQYSSSPSSPTTNYYNPPQHRQTPPPRSQQQSYQQSKEETSSSPYSEEDDQLPAASSFTQNILTTFQSPVVKKLVSSGIESSTLRNAISLLTKPKRKLENSEIRNSRKTQSEPKSFSFEILPGKNKSSRKDLTSGNAIDDTLNSLNVDVIHTSLDNFAGGSKSRKKGSVSLESTRKILNKPSSFIISGDRTTGTTLRLKNSSGSSSNSSKTKMKVQDNSKTTTKPKTGETKLKKPTNNGLKSGFFTA